MNGNRQKAAMVVGVFVSAVLLSACVGEDPDSDGPRALLIGDSHTYRSMVDGYEMEVRTTVMGTEELTVPSFSCTALVVERNITYRATEEDMPEAPSRSTESSYCLDDGYRTARTSEWQDGEFLTSFTPRLPGGAVFACLLLCADMGASGLRFEYFFPPGQDIVSWFRPNETVVDVYDGGNMNREEGCLSETAYQLDVREGPFPSEIHSSYTSRCEGQDPQGFEDTLTLVDSRRGAGPEIKLKPSAEDGAPAGPSALEPVVWQNQPAEGASPFSFPQQEAIDTLRANPEGALYFERYPDAFLSSASYREYQAQESGQTEYLWVMLWKSGSNGLWAECHRLISPVPSDDVTVSEAVVDECYDVSEREAEPQGREDYPEAVLSWESGASYWQSLVGPEVSLKKAGWTTNGVLPGPGMPSEALEASPRNELIMMFDYRESDFATDLVLPAWVATHAGGVNRASGFSSTFMDAENGNLYFMITPFDPSEGGD